LRRTSDRSDWARVRGREPDTSDPDADDASDDMRRELVRLRGRPRGSGRKEATSIRIDKDVLATFRASGPGWQTRMNEALREWLSAKRRPGRPRGRRVAK